MRDYNGVLLPTLLRAYNRAKNARYNIGICEQLALQLDAKPTSEKTKNFEKLNLIVVAQAPSPEQQQDRPVLELIEPLASSSAMLPVGAK